MIPPVSIAAAAGEQPLPIADAIADLVAADSLHERRDRVVECFRATIRYLAAITLATRVQYGPGPVNESAELEQLVRGLRRRGLTDGQWVGMVRGLLKSWADAQATYPIPGLAQRFCGRHKKKLAGAIDGLLEMRKSETVAHGGTGRGDALGEVLARREPQLEQLLLELAPIWRGARLVLPLAHPEEATTPQSAWSLMGYAPARGKWPRTELAAGTRLAPGEPVLIDEAGKPLVALHPIAMFRPPSPGAVEELFVLDGAKKGAACFVAFPSMSAHRQTEVWQLLGKTLLSGEEDADETPVAGNARPYRGLASFGAEHNALFFGRERQAEGLANRIRRHAMVTVTGASGAGKSSLLHAGVFPLLDDVEVISMRPGADPLTRLARRLAPALVGWAEADVIGEVLGERPETLGLYLERWSRANQGRRLVIFVDQAEEIFTLCRDQRRREAFADALASAGLDRDGASRVVLILREDFFSRLSTLAALRELYSRNVEVVTTPDVDDLMRIVVAPARLFGFEFEHRSLVESMVEAVVGEPAALAMVQFCAAQLWERRDRSWRRLTWDAYRAIGGVEGALASHAEATLAELTPARQAVARALLLSLVTADGTRAVVAKEDLLLTSGARVDATAVLGKLVDARLLTSREAEEEGGSDAVVELVHEALIRHWQRLRGWLADDSEFLRVRARVSAASARWHDEGRPVDLLLGDGKPMIEAEELVSTRRDALKPVDIDYVETSLARGRRRQRLKRLAVVALAVLAIVAGGLAAIASVERGRAERNADRAAASAVEADARTVALLEEQGRVELIAGRPVRALVYLSEAYSRGGRGRALMTMLAAAVDPVDARQAELVGHSEPVTAAIYSPDGSRIATTSRDHSVRLWRANGELDRVLAGHTDVVWEAAFSADGKRLVTASSDASARIWDVASGAEAVVLAGHSEWVRSARFSPDGKLVATASWDDSARLFDAATGAVIHTLAHGGGVQSVRFNAAGTHLLTASSDGSARIWAVADGRLLVTMDHADKVRLAIYSPDEARVAAISTDGVGKIWDAASGAPIASLIGHEGDVSAVAFSPDGALVATASWDRTARLWNATSGAHLATLTGHVDWVRPESYVLGRLTSIEFSPQGDVLASAGIDGTVKVWAAPSGALLASLDHGAQLGGGARYRPDGGAIVSAGGDGVARVWSPTRGALAATLARPRGEGKYARRVSAVVSDGARIVTATDGGAGNVWGVDGQALAAIDAAASVVLSSDAALYARVDRAGKVDVHRASSGALVASVDAGQGVGFAALCAGGPRLLTAPGSPGSARLWSLPAGVEIAELIGHEAPHRFATCSADGSIVVTVAASGRVKVWAGATGELRHSLVEPEKMASLVPRVEISPDGLTLLTATADARVSLWALESGALVRTFAGHSGSFSPDGSRIVTADEGLTARIWDVATGDKIAILEGHAKGVRSAIYSAGGDLIVTASADATARLWEAASGRLLMTLQGHDDELLRAIFTPDSERVISASADGTTRIWAVAPERRSAAEVATLVADEVPWQLVGGRLVPREPRAPPR